MRRNIILLLLGTLLLLFPLSLYADAPVFTGEAQSKEEQARLSAASGFYGEDLEVYITASREGELYYTTDGSAPSPVNPAAKLSRAGEPVLFACEEKEKVYTLRARLFDGEEALSDVVCGVYILGEDVGSRYTNPVLVLSGSPADLMDEETGIFSMKNRTLRGRESEREVQATLFDTDGTVRFSLNAGVRIFGAATRMKNQPSLKLYARSEYDEQNEFPGMLFEDHTLGNGNMMNLKRVVVRSGGNDNGYAHIRSEFASRLCKDAGFPDAQASSPVCLYVNGSYYGAYWFVENFDDSYFEAKYGKHDGQMVVLEDNIAYSDYLETDDEITRAVKEEYNRLYTDLAALDLKDPNQKKYLYDSIDVENFLQYMALENYFGNADAMVNNFKTYRYYSPKGKYTPGTVFDGKYRFLLYDLDQTLGYGMMDKPGAEPEIMNTANRVGYNIFYNSLFANIVKNDPEGRDTYIRYYLSLINYYCETERATAVLEEMHASREAELVRQYEETDFMVGNMETPADIDYRHVETSMELIRHFLKNRPGWALFDLEEAFDVEERYTLKVTNPGGANLSVDYAGFSDCYFEGTYFAEVPVVLTVRPQCGDKADCFVVNGEVYEGDELVIVPEMIADGEVEVECVTSYDPEAGLMITAFQSRSGKDYVELTNFGAEPVDLKDYRIGDTPEREKASTLPAEMIAPGETVTVYCRNYKGAEAIGKPAVNFNLKAGESLCLYREELIQQVCVPRTGSKEGVMRIDEQTGVFYEQAE